LGWAEEKSMKRAAAKGKKEEKKGRKKKGEEGKWGSEQRWTIYFRKQSGGTRQS